jgi:prolipoprotein diacylglyceryltransferase
MRATIAFITLDDFEKRTTPDKSADAIIGKLYQALAEGLFLGLCLLLAWKSPRRPGFIVALFLIIYGGLRIVTELYRLPDADLAVQRIAGLSRGQWLSVVMIAFGLLCLWISSRQPHRMGGWGRRQPAAGTVA